MQQLEDLQQFYEILINLEKVYGGKRTLATASGRIPWPLRGVYFFFEAEEERTHSGVGPRVVRVGTHALHVDIKSTLWQRLSQHQGTIKTGGGNHRGSIFRLHVGTALLNRGDWSEEIRNSWGKGSSASSKVRQTEMPLEQAVSQFIRRMQFLWLNVDDPPGPENQRGFIERNSIALLSNFNAGSHPLDPPSSTWLGRYANHENIRKSGLWNVKHVAETYNPRFLNTLKNLVMETKPLME